MRFAMWALVAACAAPVAPVVRNTAPAPAEPPKPVAGVLHARVLKLAIYGTDVLVDLAAGTATGIDKHSTIVSPKFPHAEVVLIRVDKTTTIEANPVFDITLAPPPPPARDDGLLDI